MKRVLKILGRIGLVLLVLLGIMLVVICKDITKMKKVVIEPIKVTQLEDGSYEGHYQFSRWEASIQVTVKNGIITAVQSLQEVFPDVSDELNEAIIKEQRNDVDAVSGATATSKAYLKAVENALTK